MAEAAACVAPPKTPTQKEAAAQQPRPQELLRVNLACPIALGERSDIALFADPLKIDTASAQALMRFVDSSLLHILSGACVVVEADNHLLPGLLGAFGLAQNEFLPYSSFSSCVRSVHLVGSDVLKTKATPETEKEYPLSLSLIGRAVSESSASDKHVVLLSESCGMEKGGLPVHRIILLREQHIAGSMVDRLLMQRLPSEFVLTEKGTAEANSGRNEEMETMWKNLEAVGDSIYNRHGERRSCVDVLSVWMDYRLVDMMACSASKQKEQANRDMAQAWARDVLCGMEETVRAFQPYVMLWVVTPSNAASGDGHAQSRTERERLQQCVVSAVTASMVLYAGEPFRPYSWRVLPIALDAEAALGCMVLGTPADRII